MRWERLKLRSQVLIVTLVFWVLALVTAIVVDVIQISSANNYEIEQRGGGFLREALPVFAHTPPEGRTTIADQFTNFERKVLVSDKNAVLLVTDGETHDRQAQWILDQLQSQGIPVAELYVTDRHVQPKTASNSPFVDFHPPEVVGETSKVDRGATIGVLSARLEDDDKWLNFYLLMSAKTFWTVLMQQSVDSIFALLLLVALVVIIGRVMSPLHALTVNAERFGRGEDIDPLSKFGSADVRDTIVSFNRMETRVSHMLHYQVAMLRSLGHDLKGPLAQLRRRIEQATAADFKDQLLYKLTSLERTVQSVADFARGVQRDKTTSLIDLPSMLSALLEDQQDMGHKAHLNVENPLAVPGRFNALTRVFQNLIENAIKYANTVEVTLKQDDEYAVITVDDTGPGLPAEQLELAFEPFQRLGADGEGSGLGLAIAQTIAIDHGGSLTLSNRPGGGLRATVRLPRENGP